MHFAGQPARLYALPQSRKILYARGVLDLFAVSLAKEYLAQHKLPITEISYQLGYSSSSTFSRAFKQQTSHSPLNYREQFKA